MFEGESVSLVILLWAELGAGRVGLESDWDPARGRTWLQRGWSAALTRPSRPVFHWSEDRTDVGGHRGRMAE